MKQCYLSRIEWHRQAAEDAPRQAPKFDTTSDEETLESCEMRWASGELEPDQFVEWLKGENTSGFARQRFAREEITRWLSTIGIPSCYHFSGVENVLSTAPDKDLGTTERNTLLKIIIGMAIQGYKYKPKETTSTKVKEIVDDIETVGLKVSDDTVRKVLKQAASLLSVSVSTNKPNSVHVDPNSGTSETNP